MSIASKCTCGVSLGYCNGKGHCKWEVKPPESSFDMSFYITLEKMDIDFAEFEKLCKVAGCVVRIVDGNWQIEAPDPVNFYWLGAHMSLSFIFRAQMAKSIAGRIKLLYSIPSDDRSVATAAT